MTAMKFAIFACWARRIRKTTLAEQMLFMTKGTDRFGKTVDGNTTCDYDAEEIKRQISISLAFAPVKYNNVKINVMDAPGNFDFSGEACPPSAPRSAPSSWAMPRTASAWAWSAPGRCWARSPG